MAESPAPRRGLAAQFPALAELGRGRRRIPAVRQLTASDCGAACLAMVLGYHGKTVRLDDVRRELGSGRRGTDAAALLEAAHRHGLHGRGVKLERLEDLETLEPATILHWGFDHFVVLEGTRPRGEADVVDPARGRRRVGRRELAVAVTGVALTFTAGDGFETGGEPAGGVDVARRYLAHVLRRSGVLWRVLLLSLVLQLLALAVPAVTGVVVDRVAPTGDRGLLLALAGGIGAVGLFHALATWIRAHLLLELRTRLDGELTLGFLDHLVDLPLEFFEERSAGDLMMRLNSNARIREVLTTGSLSTLLDGALVLLYLVLLFWLHAGFAAVVLALGLARVTVFLLTRRRQRDLMSRGLEAQAASRSFQLEMLAGVATLKSMGAEPRAVQHWSNLFVDELNATLDRGRLSAAVESCLGTLGVVSPLIMLVYGASLVVDGALSLGSMMAMTAVAAGFLAPLTTLVATATQLQLLGSYLDRVGEVLSAPKEVERGHGLRLGALSGRIAVEGVSFRYQPQAPPAVDGVSVTVEPGELVAVVGRSGAGKSTLGRLLLGLHRPTAGRILLDGHDLASLDLRWVRSRLGVVGQEPFLFGGSIRENLALADPSASLDQVIAAARAACIHDEIAALPMGYDTVLADGGTSLSGGQRQRLALARALVHQPSILLLDEATSHLDAVTERQVQRELERLRCTRIVVAHRLSTVAGADTILVMDAGGITERGGHDELLARGGLYADLVRGQLEPAAGGSRRLRTTTDRELAP